MSKLNCNVVRDILPLYADDVVCGDTRLLVEEHLAQCGTCSQELKGMRERIAIPAQMEDAESLKRFKRKWNTRQKIKGALAALLIIALIIGSFLYVYAIGIPIKAEDLMIRSGLQCMPDYDENWTPQRVSCPSEVQNWIVDIGVHSGEVRAKSEGVWEMNDSGDRVVTGVKIYVRWSPFDFPWENVSTNWVEDGPVYYVRRGVASSQMELDPGTDDFTVTIVCADQEITYSMEESGLFSNTAVHSPEMCPWAD